MENVNQRLEELVEAAKAVGRAEAAKEFLKLIPINEKTIFGNKIKVEIEIKDLMALIQKYNGKDK